MNTNNKYIENKELKVNLGERRFYELFDNHAWLV